MCKLCITSKLNRFEFKYSLLTIETADYLVSINFLQKKNTQQVSHELKHLTSVPPPLVFFQSLCQGSHFPKSSVLFRAHYAEIIFTHKALKGHDWDLSSDLWPLLTETSEITYNVLSACGWKWVEVHRYFSVLNMQCSWVTWGHLELLCHKLKLKIQDLAYF